MGIFNKLESNHIQNVLIIIILYNGSTFISSVFRNFTLNNIYNHYNLTKHRGRK